MLSPNPPERTTNHRRQKPSAVGKRTIFAAKLQRYAPSQLWQVMGYELYHGGKQ